jgi:DNA-binding CsgD family transcriptional regulator/tetratricopeptide (TPR) repeat protein
VLNSPPAPILIGREGQLTVLRAFGARVVSGRAGALLLRGDAGGGKTRLVTELASEARAAGTTVLAGGCVALGDEPLRHAALIELLRAARPSAEGPAAAVAGLPTEQVLERVLAVVDAVGAPDSLVLVFEDIHWADRGTCEILTVLARHVVDHPVGLVMTCREELPRDHHVRQFLTELGRGQLVTPVAVPPMTPAEVARFVEALLGDVDATTVAGVYDRSGGNPLIIEELCAQRADPNAAVVPGAVRDILLARFWHLSEDARELVRAVSVAGSPVSEARLATVVDLPGKPFATALREALDLRVLAPTEGGISVRHVLMAEAVYGELLSGERVRLHARWAAALSDAPAPLVAHHWYEAGEDDLAFVAGLAAAREATGALAFDDAHRHYLRVLSLWTRVDDAEARATSPRRDIVLQTAETANWAGDPAAAVAVIDGVLADADIVADRAAVSVLLERRAWYLLRQGANEAARIAYDAALDALPNEADPATRVRVLAGSVRAWERTCQYERALALAREAVAVAVDAKVEAEIGPAHYMLGRILLATGDVDTAIDELERAATAAEQTLNPVLLAISLLERGDALARRGRLVEAVPAALAAAERLRARGDTEPHALLATATAAALLHRLGRPADGRIVAARILEEARAPVIVAVGHLLAGAFDVEAMQLTSAREHLETARMLAAALLEGRVGAALATARADLAIGEGNVELAASAVDEGIAKVVHSGDDESLAHLSLYGLRIEAERGLAALGRESDRARRRRDASLASYEAHLARVLGAQPPMSVRPDLDAVRAAWTAERTRIDGATDPDSWARATELWTAAEWPRDAAYSALRHAEALARTKAPDDVVAAAFRVAEARAAALESPFLLAPVARLAQSVGVPAPAGLDALTPAAPDADDDATETLSGLTPREREVLELVMAGATNRQIATRLFISDKTASVHVSRILTKLGVTSRQDAATVARRAQRARRP